MLLIGMASCHKEEETNTNTTPQDTTQTTIQKHNVELVYGSNSEVDWQNISIDTLNKYNADNTVDTIFLVPEMYNQFSTNTTTGLKNKIVKLRERKNINPNKVFGKGELQLNNNSVIDNPEITRFFRDTLRYNVTMHYTK